MKSIGIVVSALLVGTLFIGGCSGSDDPTPTTEGRSTEQDITTSNQCKGFLPQNCQVCSDGKTACAHWTVSDKKCVVETCAAPAITSPSQCTGPLPQNCRVCDDGKTACAHWAVEKGACAIETCAPPAPECASATDCKGPLPRVARVCSDGKTHGASHVCNSGTCGIEICPQ